MSRVIPFTKKWRERLKSEVASVGVCEGYWTPVVDEGVVVLEQPSAVMANKAVEVTGLEATALLDINGDNYVIDNGNVVIFNLTGNAVAALGATLDEA